MSPLELFRRNQKVMMTGLILLAMFAFVVLPAVSQYMARTAPGMTDPVLAEFDGVSLTASRIEQFTRQHYATVQYLRKLAEETIRRGGMPQVPGFSLDNQSNQIQSVGINGSPSQESSIRTLQFAALAEDQGFALDDTSMNLWLERFTAGTMSQREMYALLRRETNNQMGQYQLFAMLRKQLLSQLFFRAAGVAVSQDQFPLQSPLDHWKNFLKLNQQATINAYSVLVDDFIEQTDPNPSQSEIAAVYEAGKDRYPSDQSAEPGFRRRETATFEYLMADLQKFRDAEIEKLTEEEIRAEYEKRKAGGAFQLPPEGAEPDNAGAEGAPAAPPRGAPAGQAPADQAPAMTAPANSPQTPAPNQPTPDQPTPDQPSPAPADENASADQDASAEQDAPAPETDPAVSIDLEQAALPNAGPLEDEEATPNATEQENAADSSAGRAADKPEATAPSAESEPASGVGKADSEAAASDENEAEGEGEAEDANPDDSTSSRTPRGETAVRLVALQNEAAAENEASTEPSDGDTSGSDGDASGSDRDASTAEASTAEASTAEASTDKASTDEASQPADQPADTDGDEPAEDAAPESAADGDPADSNQQQPRFRPYEEVRDQIAQSMVEDEARVALDQAISQARSTMKRYFSRRAIYESSRDANEAPPERPDLEQIAKDTKLEYRKIGPHSPVSLADEPIADSFEEGTALSQRGVPFTALMFGVEGQIPEQPLFRPVVSVDLESQQTYLSWKVDQREAYTPSLDEVRDEVVNAIRSAKARELAQQAAEAMVEKANAGTSLEELIPEDRQDNYYTDLGPFSWMNMVGFGNVTIGNVPQLDSVGEEFMETVFNAQPDEYVVAPNAPRRAFYVVRRTSLQPATVDLRAIFSQRSERMMAMFMRTGRTAEIQEGFFEAVDAKTGFIQFEMEP